MSADTLETETAVKALASRLLDWGVDQPAKKARAYIDELVSRGWKPGLQRTPRNPQPHEECAKHPGQYRWACGGCNADRKARRDEDEQQSTERANRSREEVAAALREQLANAPVCSHGTLREHCKDHRTPTNARAEKNRTKEEHADA